MNGKKVIFKVAEVFDYKVRFYRLHLLMTYLYISKKTCSK